LSYLPQVCRIVACHRSVERDRVLTVNPYQMANPSPRITVTWQVFAMWSWIVSYIDWDLHWIQLLSSLCRHTYRDRYAFWDQYIPTIFSHVLHCLDLPVGPSAIHMYDSKEGSIGHSDGYPLGSLSVLVHKGQVRRDNRPSRQRSPRLATCSVCGIRTVCLICCPTNDCSHACMHPSTHPSVGPLMDGCMLSRSMDRRDPPKP